MENIQSEGIIGGRLRGFSLLLSALCSVLSVLCCVSCCLAFTDEEIRTTQLRLKDQPLGKRIAFWAERFVGTPYDPDPLGEYVSKAAIVADERVDCMYLTYRAVEIAMSATPEEAVEIALDKRFHSTGRLEKGVVMNYEERFQSGEEMISSGKWGQEVTAQLGRTVTVEGATPGDTADVLPPDQLLKALKGLKTGDLMFFVKSPGKRTTGEIVGHMGIIMVEQRPGTPGHEEVFLIHAGGTKTRDGLAKGGSARSGSVRKVLLKDYLTRMSFVGAKVTRFF